MQTEYILKAMDAALAAGKEILNVYNDPSSDFQVERKADNSPLTLADRKAHETIMTYLRKESICLTRNGSNGIRCG